MNYQTKLAAAVNDYQLGLQIAKLASDDGPDISFEGHVPSGVSFKDAIKDNASNFRRNPRAAAAGMAEDLGNVMHSVTGDRMRGRMGNKAMLGATAGAGAAGLAGLGAAGIAGVKALRQHKRNQMLKQLAMGGGGAAALLGGGLLARHLSRDED